MTGPAALFPEGTTADGLSLLPFRSSLVATARTAPRPRRRSSRSPIDYGAAPAEQSPGRGMKASLPMRCGCCRGPGQTPVVLNFFTNPSLMPIFPTARRSPRTAARRRSQTALMAALGKPFAPLRPRCRPGALSRTKARAGSAELIFPHAASALKARTMPPSCRSHLCPPRPIRQILWLPDERL